MSRTGFRSVLAAIGVGFCLWRARVVRDERAEMLRAAHDMREAQIDWEDRSRRCRQWGEEPADRTQPF